jgi:hypothetical protein
MKNLYDHDILFWYLDIQRINDNILILWPYVNLMSPIVAKQCGAQIDIMWMMKNVT